jgi:hypothetical protein
MRSHICDTDDFMEKVCPELTCDDISIGWVTNMRMSMAAYLRIMFRILIV